MLTKEDQVKRIINDEILLLANELATALAEDMTDAWENSYIEETEEYVEIFQYFLVTDWMAEKLASIGEPICRDVHGVNFWGRTCCGQAIELDGTIQKIVESIYSEGV